MAEHAAHREYEQAQRIRNQLDHLAVLEKEAYRWTTELSRLAIVHVDKAARVPAEGKSRKRVQTYVAFLARAGAVTALPTFTMDRLDQLPDAVQGALAGPRPTVEPRTRCEQMALLCYYLYRSQRTGVWLDASQGLSSETIAQAVTACFGPRVSETKDDGDGPGT